MCIADVVGNQTLEFLLSGSVPQLQTIAGLVVVDIFDQKVNTDSFLDMLGDTFLLESKRYCTNRSIMADLPTELGPRKTILYLTSQSLVL